MTRRECYHCHQWVEENEKHDCWTTTEKNLTAELSEDLMANNFYYGILDERLRFG